VSIYGWKAEILLLEIASPALREGRDRNDNSYRPLIFHVLEYYSMKNNKILSEADIEYLENRLKDSFLTKDEFGKFKEDIFEKLDRILKEVITGREEHAVIAGKSSDHEDRIERLEHLRSKQGSSI
jgi:hypothetical protein